MRGNDHNSKHDEWGFTGLNIVWVGTILDGIFWIRIIRVVIVRVGVVLAGNLSGGNCPGETYPEW